VKRSAECVFLPTRKDRSLTALQTNAACSPASTVLAAHSDVATPSDSINSAPASIRNQELSTRQNGGLRNLKQLCEADILYRAVELFFHHFYNDILFSLHEPSIRSVLRAGTLDPVLACAILALTARFIPELVEKHGSCIKACDYYADCIRSELLLEAHKPSLEKIHSLLFLSVHEWGCGRGGKAVSAFYTRSHLM
jgi:hypothetical protein